MGDTSKFKLVLSVDTLQGVLEITGGGGAGLLFRGRKVVRGDEILIERNKKQ